VFKKMRLQWIAGCVLSVYTCTSSATSQTEHASINTKEIAKKPFSAVLVEYSKARSSSKNKTRIYFSTKGIRTERLAEHSEEPNLVVIKNYNSNQMWLINPVKKFFAELPSGKSVNKKQVSEEDKNQAFGVLSNKPCYGMKSEKQSVRKIGESELSVWRCMDSNDKQHLQHFSTLLGVVIRQESQDGHVSELQDITFIDDSENYFEPSAEMEQITIDELITGRLMLPEFVE
jgi:hypothetical protein